jgi:predicted metal-dependent HD superfamily phosphohydrolase/outer membrane protein assembly factor BamB
MELRDRWNRLLPDAQPLGEDLLARYAENHRHYHDQRHLTQMLDTIDELAEQADDPDAVRLAAWFHDAIYDPQAEPGANEELSAQLAELELSAYGVEAATVAEVGRLIRLTADHACDPEDANGAVLCDADLRVLSLPPDRYDDYAADIRREYRHVGDRDFARGRTTFLQRLSQQRLYATSRGREQWEQAARENVDRELASWTPRTARPIAGLVPLICLGAALGAVVAAFVLLGRGIGAAPAWPATPEQVPGFPVWTPIAGTAVAAGLACAWFRRARPRLVLIPAAVFTAIGAAAIGVCRWRWPEARPGAALSERWPYLLLASVALVLTGVLLAVARRLRSTPAYAQAPPRSVGVGVTLLCGALLTWVVVSAGEPFVQARLETANTVSTTATGTPDVLPVQLDGELAWSRAVPSAGAIAGTAGGVAELRPDGVVMSDPTTGQIRWRYSRADVDRAASSGSSGLIVSSDGRTLAAHLPSDGPKTAKGIDLPTYAVLDAESGRVLAEVHTDGIALAVDADRLLVAEGRFVVAHGVSNPTHWRTRLRCTVTRAVLLPDQAVVVDACGADGAVVRGLALTGGEQRWEVDLGVRFDLIAELDPQTWVGDLIAIPDTREVSGLLWTGVAGGSLQQWSVDVGAGRLTWSGPVPGTPRPRLGPSSCDAQLTATRSSLVLVTCRGITEPGQSQLYDVAAVNPADGTPQWHHLLTVPPKLQRPVFPRDGFRLLPDGRVVTLMPQADGRCAPVLVGTTGVQPRPLVAGPTAAIADTSIVTCDKPVVAVAAGRPVFSDGNHLFALR